MIDTTPLLSALNEQQREAVLHIEGDSLILAGAGAGKTHVLTTKIAYLLTQGYAPYQILALTFTNKAAEEMRTRIGALIGPDLARHLMMGTFHSIFARLLRRYASHLGYDSNFSIYDSNDSRTLIKTLIKERGLDAEAYKEKSVASLISSLKNSGREPAHCSDDHRFQQYLSAKRMPEFPSLYTTYCTRCRTANAMDFDDLLLQMYRLLHNHPEVRGELQGYFRYILVDEYQDTNRVQNAIVRLLKAPDTHICVVGDDAQSIYSFRGAVIDNILQFATNFPSAQLFKLTKNYRSTTPIVNIANSLIEKNTQRIPKVVESVLGEGDRLDLTSCFTANAEAQSVAARIQVLIHSKGVDPEEIAVLYRTNAQSRLLEENLRLYGIPHRIYGGLSFFERKEIKDVLAYLRLVLNPNDDEAFRRIYNTPARGIGASTFAAIDELARDTQRSYLSVASDPLLLSTRLKRASLGKISSFIQLIEQLAERHHNEEPETYLATLIRLSGIPSLYTDGSVESQSKLENIEELQSALAEFIQSRSDEGDTAPSIETFVREVALYTDRDMAENDDTPKVTLMTMHASKGLEYQHVYLVGIEEGIIPSMMSNLDGNIEEERRLLYVAITRAKQHCSLTYATERMLHGKTMNQRPSRFLFDLDPQWIEDRTGLLQRRQRDPQQLHTLPDLNEAAPAPTPLRRSFRTEPTPPPSSSEKLLPTVSNAPYSAGDRVSHAHFGTGEVEGFVDSAMGLKVHIRFEEQGVKVLLVKYARLKLLP